MLCCAVLRCGTVLCYILYYIAPALQCVRHCAAPHPSAASYVSGEAQLHFMCLLLRPPPLLPSSRPAGVSLQAKLVARALSGRAVLPSQEQMLQDIADFYQLLIDSGVPVRYTHNQVR